MLRCALVGCTNEVKYRMVALSARAGEKQALTTHVCPFHREEQLNLLCDLFVAVVVTFLRDD